MKRLRRLSIALFAAVVLALGLVPTLALANDSTDPVTASGTYNFTSIEDSTIQLTDTFEFRESCFKRSSMLGCEHLPELSAQAAIASAAVYVDEKEVDCSKNSKNIRAMLTAMGFTDVEGNNYVDAEKLPNSAGCVVGQMTIQDGDKTYTLLAVMPLSSGYKQEWAGNLDVGASGMHEGFKAGRDEILRFVKNYIDSHEVSGDLKIWVAGYSRGAALANALGGFFAEGGSGYFEGVSIAPEDVYCYCFGTPRPILQTGLTKAQVLSVEGARGGRYAADSSGAAFTYAGDDASSTINPSADVYKCIRNYAPDYDLITLLPPSSWDFTYYGTTQPLSDGSTDAKAKMLTRLQSLSTYAYGLYTNGGDESTYAWKTFDFSQLEIVDDTGAGTITQADMFAQRVAGLAYLAGSRATYASDYQSTLAALGALFGMAQDDFFPAIIADTETAAKAAAFSYLAYASERLQAEGSATSEAQAITIAVEELIAYISGTTIDPATFTADDLLYTLAKFLIDGVDLTLDDSGNVSGYTYQSKTSEMVIPKISEGLLSSIPAEYQAYLGFLVPGWSGASDEEKPEVMHKYVLKLINSCVYGMGTKEVPGTAQDAASARGTVFGLVSLLGGSYPDIVAATADAGSHNASELIQAVLPMFMTVTDTSGTTTSYTGVADAADAAIGVLVDKGMAAALSSGRYTEGSTFYNDLVGYGNTLKTNAAKLRRLLMYGLLYTDGKTFDTEANVRNACTFVSQTDKLMAAHINETYLAWMGVDKDKRAEHVITYTTVSGDGGEWTKGDTTTLDFRFSRSEEDSKALSHFTGLKVDSVPVAESNYSTQSGSVIAKLEPSYLKTLANGEHTLTAMFDDGNDPEVTFTIQGKDEPEPGPDDPDNPDKPDPSDNGNGNGAPWTGDSAVPLFFVAALLAAGILLVLTSRALRRRTSR